MKIFLPHDSDVASNHSQDDRDQQRSVSVLTGGVFVPTKSMPEALLNARALFLTARRPITKRRIVVSGAVAGVVRVSRLTFLVSGWCPVRSPRNVECNDPVNRGARAHPLSKGIDVPDHRINESAAPSEGYKGGAEASRPRVSLSTLAFSRPSFTLSIPHEDRRH